MKKIFLIAIVGISVSAFADVNPQQLENCREQNGYVAKDETCYIGAPNTCGPEGFNTSCLFPTPEIGLLIKTCSCSGGSAPTNGTPLDGMNANGDLNYLNGAKDIQYWDAMSELNQWSCSARSARLEIKATKSSLQINRGVVECGYSSSDPLYGKPIHFHLPSLKFTLSRVGNDLFYKGTRVGNIQIFHDGAYHPDLDGTVDINFDSINGYKESIHIVPPNGSDHAQFTEYTNRFGDSFRRISGEW